MIEDGASRRVLHSFAFFECLGPGSVSKAPYCRMQTAQNSITPKETLSQIVSDCPVADWLVSGFVTHSADKGCILRNRVYIESRGRDARPKFCIEAQVPS